MSSSTVVYAISLMLILSILFVQVQGNWQAAAVLSSILVLLLMLEQRFLKPPGGK